MESTRSMQADTGVDPRELLDAVDAYLVRYGGDFVPELIVKYSRMERVEHVADVQHPIVREALKVAGIDKPHLDITSMADIPSGTGLGSSGTFTVALMKGLALARRQSATPSALACWGTWWRRDDPARPGEHRLRAHHGLRRRGRRAAREPGPPGAQGSRTSCAERYRVAPVAKRAGRQCGGIGKASGVVGDDGDTADALGGELRGQLRHGRATFGGLAAGHGHGVVE